VSRLATVILTYNEQLNLGPCLESTRGLDHTLLVVDSGSTDATLQLAANHGARVISHPFESHARQWEWALGQLDDDVEWVLGLDADQRLTPELRDEIMALFACEQQRFHYAGFYLKRRQIFRGRWIRYGGYYPKYLLKLFRRDCVKLDARDLMDHHFYVAGPTAKMRGDLIEDNRNEAEISFWISKHVRYADLHAREELARRGDRHARPIQPNLFGTPDQRTLWQKQLWWRLPLYTRPLAYFLYRYVLLRGFLDGKQGFIFHFLQAFWYRLLVDIRIEELRQG
jgi:glycosyltransferase involved in cell wall biosynthesis